MYGEATYGLLLWSANLAAVTAVAATGAISSQAQAGDSYGVTISVKAAYSAQAIAGPPDGGNVVTWDDSLLWNDSQVWTEAIGWQAIANAFGSRSDSASASDTRASVATGLGLWSGTAQATSQFLVPLATTTALSTNSAKAADTEAALAVAFGSLTSSASAVSSYLTVQGPLGVMIADATASDLTDSLASAFAAWASPAQGVGTFAETSGNLAVTTDNASAADTTTGAAVTIGLLGAGVIADMFVVTGQSISVITTTSTAHADDEPSAIASALGAWSSTAHPGGPFATVFLLNVNWAAEAAAFSQHSYESLTSEAISAEALAADTFAATSQAASEFIMYSRPQIALLTGRTRAA